MYIFIFLFVFFIYLYIFCILLLCLAVLCSALSALLSSQNDLEQPIEFGVPTPNWMARFQCISGFTSLKSDHFCCILSGFCCRAQVPAAPRNCPLLCATARCCAHRHRQKDTRARQYPLRVSVSVCACLWVLCMLPYSIKFHKATWPLISNLGKPTSTSPSQICASRFLSPLLSKPSRPLPKEWS